MSGRACGGPRGRSGNSFVRAAYASGVADWSSSMLLVLGGDKLNDAQESLLLDKKSEKELCGTGGRMGETQQSGLSSIALRVDWRSMRQHLSEQQRGTGDWSMTVR